MCVFPLKSFHIEDIKCLMPCDFAPGLSFPYPSKRLITPQMPRPAPRAITSVCKTPTALLKNAIIKLLSAALRLPEKGHKKRRSVFDNCRGHKSPRCVCCCGAAVFSCRGVRLLPLCAAPESRGAYHVARVYYFYFKLPPFQKVVCRQA